MARTFVRLDEVAAKLELINLTPAIDLHKIKVYHRSINRPAFQLAGYFDYFDNQRIQIIGRAETLYLSQFSIEENLERWEKILKYGFPGAVFTRGMRPEDELLKLAESYGVPILMSENTTAYVIVEMIRWINEVLAPTENIYGVLVDVYGEGILITGESGIGKSEVALELIKRGHRLVADDLVEISKISENLLIGHSPNLTQHFIELRGLGVVDVKSLYGVESVKETNAVDVIVHLESYDPQKQYDRLGLTEEYQEILDVKLVKHSIPVSPGRNIAIIIETAAVNSRQKKMGYNAAQALCDKVSEAIRYKETEVENDEE